MKYLSIFRNMINKLLDIIFSAITLTIILFLLFSLSISAQITFQRTYGVGTYNEGRSVKQTLDGGYIVAGTTSDAGNGATDVYLLKVDSLGNFQWHKTFGGSGIDRGYAVEQLNDSGYAVAGYTNSSGNGGYDGYLVRTNKNGDTLWTKTYGTSNWDFIFSMKKTLDYGFVLAGNSYGNSSGYSEAYLLKTDSDGVAQWTRSYNVSDDAFINSIALSPDNGYTLAGYKESLSNGNEDVLIIQTDFSGDTVWTKNIGNTNDERANAVDVNNLDSTIVAAGYSRDINSGNYDNYLVKLDFNGNTTVIQLFPQAGIDVVQDIHIIDNRCIVAAYTNSFGIGNLETQYYLTDAQLGFITGTTHGGTEDDIAYHIEATSDGGYILCGSSTSFAPGLQSVYLIKLDSLLQTSPIVIGIPEQPGDHFLHNYPNPFHDYTIIKFKNSNSSKTIDFSLFNTLGKLVFFSTLNYQKELTFYRNDLPSGIYIYQLKDENKIIGHGKMVIE